MSEGLSLVATAVLPLGWAELGLKLLRRDRSTTFNPTDESAGVFELYSVPSHETGRPEIINASEIGSNKQYVSPGDVLLSKINPRLNRAWVVGDFSEYPKIASTEWIVFSKSENVDPRLLRFVLTYARVRDYLSHNASGVGGSLMRVKPALVDTISIGLPPIAEQIRIVAKLEELFSDLDKGIENLKTAREQLKVYRQAVLKHAFEGKLTAQWREQNQDKLESPDELLARIKHEREARYENQVEEWKAAVKQWEVDGKPGKKPAKPKPPPTITPIANEMKAKLPQLPDGWAWLRLGYIAEVSGGITKNQKRNDLTCRMKYLRVANVYADRLLTDEIYEIGVTEEEASKIKLQSGDLLVVEGNGSIEQIGRVAVWADEVPNCGHQNHLIRVRLGTSSEPRFLLNFLLSPLGRDLIVREASSTSGLHTLSISKVSNLIVPVAPRAEEEAALGQIAERLSKVDSVLNEIEVQLARSEALRQSILKKAFSGKLVAQDPTDESASALLKRIKAENEERGKKKSKRKNAA